MDLSLRTLKEALEIRQQIDELEKRLLALFTQSDERQSASGGHKRTMSAAGRARISAAAKARWAGARAKQSGTSGNPTTRKRGITSAGRKRLSELMKARWAARKAKTGRK